MTSSEIKHLAKTAAGSINLLMADAIWQKAFKEYNHDVAGQKFKRKKQPYLGGQELKMSCRPCYSVVYRYLNHKFNSNNFDTVNLSELQIDYINLYMKARKENEPLPIWVGGVGSGKTFTMNIIKQLIQKENG